MRANLSDGSALVLGCLKDRLWQVGRRFLPEQGGAGAEAEARSGSPGPAGSPRGSPCCRAAARFRGGRRGHRRTGWPRQRRAPGHTSSGSGMAAPAARCSTAPRRQRPARCTCSAPGRHRVGAGADGLRARERNRGALQPRRYWTGRWRKTSSTDDDAQPLRDMLFGRPRSRPLHGHPWWRPLAGKPAWACPAGERAVPGQPARPRAAGRPGR